MRTDDVACVMEERALKDAVAKLIRYKKKAWENVSARKDCITCYNTCFNEYNQIFDLRLGVMWNNFMNYLGNRKRKDKI